ncbi:putative ent-kaurene synthase protein [Botrytis fragariae]|uniref:Putative ent-kaurene synthase protein n=1 Tax=Botrytis fragariae TaxID=1964551 RepID=A0A8H6ASY3_9HELO|nr:putative ent-kaurene synthase protein [Botrytis fragariae]KAF5873021.1 putative ent-kaurene synthase protein [Botrytis fragariae]
MQPFVDKTKTMDLSSEDTECDEPGVCDRAAVKKDLFFIAIYERSCLNQAISSAQGVWKFNALIVHIGPSNLYGQMYVARDLTLR